MFSWFRPFFSGKKTQECYALGGEHRSYGCMLYQLTSKDACTQVRQLSALKNGTVDVLVFVVFARPLYYKNSGITRV